MYGIEEQYFGEKRKYLYREGVKVAVCFVRLLPFLDKLQGNFGEEEALKT